MAAALLPLPLAEYLESEYEPDCEYIDGVLEERYAGYRKHSEAHVSVGSWLMVNAPKHAQQVLLVQRVQLSPSRVRIPDVCLIPSDDRDEVTHRPPSLWVEILSPDDRWYRVQAKIRDILAFGVPVLWIIDPYSREAWSATQSTPLAQVEDGMLRHPDFGLELPFNEILPAE